MKRKDRNRKSYESAETYLEKLREITSSEVDIRLILAHRNHCVTVKAVQCSYKAEEHFLLSHDIGSLPIVHKFQLGIFPLPKLLCCIN
jgi:hypothetical protein